jgi:4-diphosphocytidyl-2-C-methyl-D-erythritol kinase
MDVYLTSLKGKITEMEEQKGRVSDNTHSIEIKARAKVNLSLDVTGKRPDGYHNIKTIMQTIKLYDKVVISKAKKGIEVVCSLNHLLSGNVPPGNDNIAYEAAKLFKDRYCIDYGVKIIIEKNIPVAAGLAGGSSNAAAVLKGMDKLFECGATDDDLISLGRNIGADVPYCIKGGTMFAEGIGDILTELRKLPQTWVLLVIPNIEVSTRWVYRKLNLSRIYTRPDMDLLLETIRRGRVDLLAINMVNILETVTACKYTEINTIKEQLKDLGALGSIMSGSGPSVFGLFEDKHTAKRAEKTLIQTGWNVILTETL